MTRRLLTCFSILMAATFPVMGIPGVALQQQLDPILVGGAGIDVTADFVDDALDSFWEITSPRGSTASFLIELSTSQLLNEFGLYDMADPDKMVTVFAGGDGEGSTAHILIDGTGQVFLNGEDTQTEFDGNAFGLFLANGDSTWYSDSSRNSGEDHFFAYGVSDATLMTVPLLGWENPSKSFTDSDYLFAWEDSALGGTDGDFTDMVLMMESVDPLPLPEAGMTLCMLGIALMALHRVRRA